MLWFECTRYYVASGHWVMVVCSGGNSILVLEQWWSLGNGGAGRQTQ